MALPFFHLRIGRLSLLPLEVFFKDNRRLEATGMNLQGNGSMAKALTCAHSRFS
jgi:hypothetical protein